MAIANTYVERVKGYIVDVPKLFFKRCDGTVFTFDKLTAFTSSNDPAFQEISAGWANTPVA